MKNESDVKKRVKEILNELECFWYMPVQTGYGVQGIPDFVCCINSRFVGIETKFGKNTLSSWQEKQRDSIIESGGAYLVINEKNIDELMAIIMALKILSPG